MKNLIFLILFAANVAHADVNFGKKTEFVSTNGKSSFGLQMTSSLTALTFSINADEVTQGKTVTRVLIRFADRITGEFLSDLLVVADFATGTAMPGTQAFTASVSGADARKVQSMLKTSVLLIGVKDGSNNLFSGYVDLGQHCSTSKNQFVNLDSGAVGCPDSSSYANVPKLSVCLSKVVVDNSWVGKISSELECLSKNSDFKNGMSYLCSKNQTELSIPYQKFTEMNAKVNAAFAAYKNATDPVSRQQASDDLEDAKRKRSMFGYENEVYQAMSAANSGHEACAAK